MIPAARLAVLLHADVVESTTLVQRDERVAHGRMREAFQRLSDSIETWGGRTLEVRGDALVADFSRASDAVCASLVFQMRHEEANVAIHDDVVVGVRIGIALGEVVIGDGTVTGAGIILAQRLEQLAPRGAVILHGAAYETLPRRLPLVYDNLGEHVFKGFEEPMRAFQASLDKTEALPEPDASTALGLPDNIQKPKSSLAILPFGNSSVDSEQEFFVDGLTEDLITDLSKLPDLRVIARNSSFAYRGRTVEANVVGRELDVTHVLAGSIRRAGNRVRINVQLVEAATNGHVWADRFDHELNDIFALQDRVTSDIVRALSQTLGTSEIPPEITRGTRNTEAYELFLHAREQWYRHDRPGTMEAIRVLENVVSLDPSFAQAYVFLGMAQFVCGVNGWGDHPQSALERAHDYSEHAILMDPNEPMAHLFQGVFSLRDEKYEDAIAQARKAVSLDPNLAHAHADLGWFLACAGRPDEALEALAHAQFLDPQFSPQVLHFLALAHFVNADYRAAASALRRRLLRNPDSDRSNVLLCAAYGHLGELDAAQAAWREANRLNPDLNPDSPVKLRRLEDQVRIRQGLALAGVAGSSP